MTHYDFTFPLGSACASSLALRAAKLQFASLPLDWTAGGDVVSRARLVAEDFKDWMRLEDLELIDVQYATFNSNVYRNRVSGLVFSHDFPAGCYLEDELPDIAAKYDRRIRRLYAEIAKAKRVLVVYNEVPYRDVAAEADVLEAQRILQARFPDTRIDLLYFAQDPECKDREPRVLNENATMILLDYHSIDQGYVCVAALYYKMIVYLRDRMTMTDTRTSEEIARAEAAKEAREARRWGTGLAKWTNRRAYRLYRHLERFLAKRGCIPAVERPIPIYKDRGERKRAIGQPDISFLPRDEVARQVMYDCL